MLSTIHFSPSNESFLPVMTFFSQQCHFHLLRRLGHQPSARDTPPLLGQCPTFSRFFVMAPLTLQHCQQCYRVKLVFASGVGG